jgi:hypothetical protein
MHLTTLDCSAVSVAPRDLPWQDSQFLCLRIASLPGLTQYHQAPIVHRTPLIVSLILI